jgi:imidazolonepropionase-like amidohydrolase
MAGFTTVRNLGLMVYTAGFVLDVDLMKAVDNGWFPGPRIFPAGHAITPTGGHLDPTMFQGLAPGIMPQSVEQGIANGVAEVRKAVRYQIKYGAKLIKISASGGVMSFSSAAGCQQYSDEELAAIVDEAHRNGLRVAAHAHGDSGIRACIRAGVDCIEHGSLATDDTVKLMADTGTFLVGTTALADHMAIDRIHPILQQKAAEIFPAARRMFGKALEAGVKIACGSDAPAIPHGTQADELIAMVDRGMTPMQALQAATMTSADLIEREHDLGRLAPGYLADVIAVPGDPSEDIKVTKDVSFVMKDGHVYKGA